MSSSPGREPPGRLFEQQATLAGNLIGSALYGTRWTPPPTRPPIHIYLIHSRDRRRVVLPVYGHDV